jgi:hypothetical protein
VHASAQGSYMRWAVGWHAACAFLVLLSCSIGADFREFGWLE